MMYIWAWQAAPLPPLAWTSSRIAAAAAVPRPLPPMLLRDQHGEETPPR